MTFMIYTWAYLFVGIAVSTMVCLLTDVKKSEWHIMVIFVMIWPILIAVMVGGFMARLFRHITKGSK